MVISLITLLALLTRSFSQQLYYVKPTNVSPCPTSAQFCLTIEEYAEKGDIYFHSRSAFIFLPGIHQSDKIIYFVNVSTVSLVGQNNSIIDFIVNFENVFNLTIEKMAITSASGKHLMKSVLIFKNSKAISISEISFKREFNQNDTFSNRAISFNHSNATIKDCIFSGNSAVSGAAVHMVNGTNAIFIRNIFIRNTAQLWGGALFSYQSSMQFLSWNTFINNSASAAGSIYCRVCEVSGLGKLEFVGNTAPFCGGAICFVQSKAALQNITAIGNSVSSIYTLRSEVKFEGRIVMKGNIGQSGGAMVATASTIQFHAYALFEMNYASIEGGAIAAIGTSTISFAGTTLFINNKSKESGGGAILATVHVVLIMRGTVYFSRNNSTLGGGGAISLTKNSNMFINNKVTFAYNQAMTGGAIYIWGSTITLSQGGTMVTKYNRAALYGGALFHFDSIDIYQCSFFMQKHITMTVSYMFNIFIWLPDCFLKLDNFNYNSKTFNYGIYSFNDTAGLSGHFLYGGLLDKCRVYDYKGNVIWASLLYYELLKKKILQVENSKIDHLISSEPFTLCFCENDQMYDCIGEKNISILRGAEFQVSVLALSQGFTMTAPLLLAKISRSARLGLDQDFKNISIGCTSVTYNLYSTQDHETMVLYPEQSCRDEGLARAKVHASFQPCPHGSILFRDKCNCEKRLLQYDDAVTCTVVNNGDFIIAKKNTKFWVQTFFNESNNNEYEGLILYNSCPLDYCKNAELNITLKEPDVQCDFNHSGVLCGACTTNYSLTLGNTKCKKCSNANLILILLFAAMGIFLIFFISVLRLTVATGVVNSLILYANIVQANKSVFLPNSGTNILTVFVAWMNLDLGFPICFFDGMDAYTQTWLQFVFPIYIWVLIGVITIISRYSKSMTRLIGSNPVAVLATLFLMSYAKLLKTIIQIFFSVTLAYPNDIKVKVWLKDANEPYLRGRHLILAIFGSLFIAVFFFPYTLFLLFGSRLYKYSDKVWINWITIKMKPLLDSYHAPYQKHTRYWTGLLLVLHCILYIVFSYNGLGRMSDNLLAIITGYTAVIVAAWLHVKIYTNFYANVVEALVYLDLIVLSAATACNDNHPVLVYVLIGIVFAIAVGIITYQFYSLYVSKLQAWQRIVFTLPKLNVFKRDKNGKADNNEQTSLTNPTGPGFITKSEISFRESLIEDYGTTDTN